MDPPPGLRTRADRMWAPWRRVGRMGLGNEESWAVETSRDGHKWRALGRAWKSPGEPVLMHVSVRYVRFRQLLPTAEAEWSEPLESEGALPMTLVRMEDHARQDLWPDDSHIGLPMLLPGGENGRLERFEHEPDGSSWRYTLEFRGSREG